MTSPPLVEASRRLTEPDLGPERRVHPVLVWSGIVALLVVVAAVVPLGLAHHYGVLDAPRSDDWSYLRTLYTWHDEQRWDFNNWVSMTLVGQVVMTQPVVALFGDSITAVRVFVAGLGIAGLVAVVALAQLLDLPRRYGVLVAVAVACTPLWGPLAGSYMTDVPAFATQTVALAVAGASLRRATPSRALVFAAFFCAFVAISIRQYAVVPAAAYAAVAYVAFRARGERRAARAVLASVVVLAVATVLLLAWWNTVPRGKALGASIPTVTSVRLAIASVGGFLRLAGLALLPVVAVAGPRRLLASAFAAHRRVAAWTVASTTAVLLLSYGLNTKRPFVGNYLEARGALADDILRGTRPLILPEVVFLGLVVLGSLSGIVLVAAAVPWCVEAVQRFRRRDLTPSAPVAAMLAVTVAGYALVYEAAIVVDLPIFDRYALSTLPLVGLLVLRAARQEPGTAPSTGDRRDAGRRAIAVAAALVFVGALGFAYTAESASYDGTRWAVAEAAVARGYEHTEVEGGYEWVGWFRGDGPLTADTVAERKVLRRAYFEGLCVTVKVNLKRVPDDAVAWKWSSAPTRDPLLIVAVRNDRTCARDLGTDG